MTNLRADTVGHLFYSHSVSKWLYEFRRWRSGAAYIGDITYFPYEEVYHDNNQIQNKLL